MFVALLAQCGPHGKNETSDEQTSTTSSKLEMLEMRSEADKDTMREPNSILSDSDGVHDVEV